MEIIWHGQSCFTLKGSKATVVTDPYGDIGLKLPSLKANILTVSHDHEDHNNVAAVEDNPQLFDWPGEYEANGVMMTALNAFHYRKSEEEDEKAAARGKTLIFHFEIDGIKVCHLGDLGHKLTDDMVEAIGDVDILLIPAGGDSTIDHKTAHQVIEQIDPRIVIPMHYKIPGLKVEADLQDVEPFLKEMGVSSSESQEKLEVKGRSSLPEATTAYVVLEAQLG
ncbi:MBL fold metallo-hydrolase [Candidatus Peregrinibacteria bacterium]|nr:MBL fold metallo-hydrolase [Candidatus Peregrinibacteria bacterium]MBT7484337.1 MBL fold metallo-hydrolase [Candidatus Peregrinibacteria bacterium]MBT7703419.1 MBL fold metallo-hydrolase [Candidatus Peregrinibacteria bacterium]